MIREVMGGDEGYNMREVAAERGSGGCVLLREAVVLREG